jgi:Protein of unknown function (DUF1592)/Protein of unknown function (DUF1588)/Protein of unknown function (DUF1587)/Protein of unknown function (DUF1585)/Protein of unknown function (DUF1595)/Planctomycete cytochrome C
MSTHSRRWFLALFVALAGVTGLCAADLPAPVQGFVTKQCVSCHDADTHKGGLDFTALKTDLKDPATFTRWVRIHDRVRAGEMPPPTRKPPSTMEREVAVKSLAGLLTGTDSRRQSEQGRVPLRRLNRTEYENTMRDLFSLPGLEVKDLLPEDGRYDGFDKASAALDLSAVQLRKYLEVADVVLDAAIAHQDKPIVWKHRYRQIGGLHTFGEGTFPINKGKVDLELIKEIDRVREDKRTMPFDERQKILETLDSLGILTTTRPSLTPNVGNFSPFHSGFYRFRTSVWCFHLDSKFNGELRPADRTQSLVLTASGRVLAYFDAPSLKPREHEVVVWLNAAEDIQLNPANLWANFNRVAGYVGPAVAVDFVEVEGPLHDTWPPASHRRLFGKLPIAELPVRKDASPPESYPRQPPPAIRHPGSRPHHVDGPEFNKWQPVWTAASPRPAEDAERLLKDFLPRAFRRPVGPDELAVYVRIARDRLANGDFFETAMRTAYRTALCSPDFLFHQEPSTYPKDPSRLDQYAIASRLSYFLWNSMPDEELFELAAKNQLGGKMSAQIDRMLADPRSNRLVEDFLDQWLELRKIDFTSPDAKLYPEYRPDLRDAMLAETRAYFREMLTHDLGVSHIVDSDFLTINQRLAEHYGIPGVDGSATRRVAKPEDSPYGGLLTQGAILKVTANGTATSPVQRGAWVMNRILGKPPQPPPPNIAAIDPDIRGTVTIREQLDKHRTNATCAACHAKIDPPGFALENFDVIGAWRTKYRFVGEKVDDPSMRKGQDPSPDRFLGVGVKQWEYVVNGVRLGLPVDPSGTTADGKAFHDIREFKQLLLTDEEALARNLVERLILYSTGAPVGFADRTQVDQILKRSRDSKFGLRTLVREIILNPAIFQRK